ncbi:cGMP-dependent protein kinase [Aureococcus anophagefferens]|uniref:cGMP-dependent protein kinase n=1 Tax=Aureococcus anophagefferens TaxID=44056 RepID=A0ABR1GGH8_AURAN
MPRRTAAEQRKVDRKVAKTAEEAAECKRLKDAHDDFKNSDAAPGPHRDKKLKKLYDDWYDYYVATGNGKRQIKREAQNSLSNNLHKKLEAARADDTLRETTKKQKVDELAAQAAAAKAKTHAAEESARNDAKRQKVIDLREDARAVAADASLKPSTRKRKLSALAKQVAAAEEDTHAAQQRRQRLAAYATHQELADELAVLLDDEDADEDDVADLTARVQAAEEDTPAARSRRQRLAAYAAHKALADELAVLLDDEDADEDDVADLTARVQAAWLKTGAGYSAARRLADLEAEIRASAATGKVPPGKILERARAIARAVVDYSLQEIRAGRRVSIGNARFGRILEEAKRVPRREGFAVKGPRGGTLPWSRFSLKLFPRVAETVVGNVAEKYAHNMLANHEAVTLDDFAYDNFGSGGVHHDEELGDTGLYVLSLEPRATDTTRPSRYILGREVEFSDEFEAELAAGRSPAGMPTSARKDDLDVYMQDFSATGSPVYRVYTRGTWAVFTYKKKPDSPFNGLQKFKWGSSAVARAKAQAKIDEKSVKGNYVVVGSDSWV